MGAVIQTLGECQVLAPPACHHRDDARLSSMVYLMARTSPPQCTERGKILYQASVEAERNSCLRVLRSTRVPKSLCPFLNNLSCSSKRCCFPLLGSPFRTCLSRSPSPILLSGSRAEAQSRAVSVRPERAHQLGQQAVLSSLPGEMVWKSEVRMLRLREEMFPRPSGSGGEQEVWALSCRCLAQSGHLTVQQKALQDSGGVCSHGLVILALPSCAPLACAPQHSFKSISFA